MGFIRLSCPRCRGVLAVGAGALREKLTCPHCQRQLVLPLSFFDSLTWYYGRDCQMDGPFSFSQLQELAAAGQLQASDWLWRRGAQGWVSADSFAGLFPRAKEEPARKPLSLPTHTGQQPADDIFSEPAAPLASNLEGPFTQKGIKVHPQRSLTLGDFQILKKVGAGAMGAVYLACQRSKNRAVALKVLSRHLAVQPRFVQRFFREALVLGSLNHPNIVAFYGSGQEKDFPYFAMEYVDGFSTTMLEKHCGGRLPVPDALHIVVHCAEALAYAHEHNIVHRDIKPENIMITRVGQVKIADLGLAKPLHEDQDLTESGAGLGTPKYMAPEQARNAKRADQRCDIYALGGVLYHYLTGTVPFQGESAMELLLAKEKGLFPSARRRNQEVPPRLDLLIDKMLARDVKYRYQNCQDLLRDLHSLGITHQDLSFDLPNVMQGSAAEPPAYDRVEILLIHDDAGDILLAQEALEESGVPSNLNVFGDGLEAWQFLRRQGQHAAAPHPHLIILGRNLQAPGSPEVLAEIKNSEELRNMPLVVLADSPGSMQLLQKHGLKANLTIARSEDFQEFKSLIKSVYALCLTTAENSGQ